MGNFETYTRYSEIADEKKLLGGDCLFKLSKGGDLKKETFFLRNPDLESKFKRLLFMLFKTTTINFILGANFFVFVLVLHYCKESRLDKKF